MPEQGQPVGRRQAVSKSRAALPKAGPVACAALLGPACSSAGAARSKLAQGYPAACAQSLRFALIAVCALWSAGWAAAAAPCQPVPLTRLAPGLWLVPAVAAESDAVNRGHSSHLLLARDGQRLWAVGSGPTPAFGERLRCTAQQRLGQAPTDELVPWAKAELALGSPGLAAARSWAHERVAAAMAQQCAHCVDRLRQRLAGAAGDLGDDPVRLPQRLLRGQTGRLGPFDWWVLPRAEGRVVTVLRHRNSGVMVAHGLLWGDGPPDARDGEVVLMAQSLARLPSLPPASGRRAAVRWVGETGPLLDAGAVAAQAAYLQALAAAAHQAAQQGDPGLQVPLLPGHEAASAHPRHALNWQRAVRQAEDEGLRAPR